MTYHETHGAEAAPKTEANASVKKSLFSRLWAWMKARWAPTGDPAQNNKQNILLRKFRGFRIALSIVCVFLALTAIGYAGLKGYDKYLKPFFAIQVETVATKTHLTEADQTALVRDSTPEETIANNGKTFKICRNDLPPKAFSETFFAKYEDYLGKVIFTTNGAKVSATMPTGVNQYEFCDVVRMAREAYTKSLAAPRALPAK